MRIRSTAGLGLAALALVLTAPSSAMASHWWWSNGHPVHLAKPNFPSISFHNNATAGSWTALEHARGDWAADPALDLYNVGGGGEVTAWDGHWGGTGWGGLATAASYDGQHTGAMWVQINMSYNQGYNWQRAVACQEIGHAVGGMDHAGPGCMGMGYQGVAPAASNNFNDPQVRQPSAHDREHTWYLWAGGFH